MEELIKFIKENHIITAGVIVIITWLIAFIASRLMSKKVLVIPAKLSKKDKEEISVSQYTRLKLAKRLILLSIYLIGISIALVQIQAMRSLGTALLASAGFIGLIGGLAARASLSNLVAGITIAFVQPIRLKDYVKIDGEFGQVEELTLTYTIIKTWDLRRLVVPNSVIVDSPVRNYSLSNPEIMVETDIPLKSGSDIDKAKRLLVSFAKESEYYGKKTEPEVSVSAFGDEAVVLRVAALAKSAKDMVSLSSDIREKAAKIFPAEDLPFGKM